MRAITMALVLLHLPTLALNAAATLVYPLYSSYKAVTSSKTSLPDMEVWLVYWSVFACWTLLESVFGFLWSWLPFYYEFRLLFNIWLVAPQTRGATYIYTNHLHPFLQSNQQQIDAWIEDAKRNVKAKMDDSLGGLLSAWSGGSAAEGGAAPQPNDARHRAPAMTNAAAPTPAPAPPTQHNPAQASMSMLGNLVKQYAPLAIASAKALLETKPPPPNVSAYTIHASGSSSKLTDHQRRQEAMERRRQLESHLAALDASGVPSSTSSSSNGHSNSSGDEAPAPVTMINPGKQPRSSLGTARTLRNRLVSGSAKTAQAGAAMGESYDLLDQNDIPPLHASPKPTNWIPWTPASQ